MNELMARRRAMMGKKQSGGLPNDYQEVEYVQSDGVPYIQTDHKFNGTAKVKVRLACVGNQSTSNYFGVNEQATGALVAFGVISFSSAHKLGFFVFGGQVQAIPFDNVFHDYYISKDGVSVDGTSYTLSGTVRPSQITKSLKLFRFVAGGNASLSPSKLGRIEISLDGNDYLYVPCYRKSDDEIGFYELTTQTFYTNANNTGTFTKGADV